MQTPIRIHRRLLAQAITAIECGQSFDIALFTQKTPAKRIGITGPPGAGKSSLINSLGSYILERLPVSLAVLSIDPSSPISGGSLLGDKTRMPGLSKNERVFIRTSPTQGKLGGTSKHTKSIVNLCSKAGYDIIFIESTGVGQSELDITGLADKTILVLPPASGDELQAIKRGIMELVDVIVVNQCDGDFQKQAQKTRLSYLHALRMMGRQTKVLCTSALSHMGISDLWKSVQSLLLIVFLGCTACINSKTSVPELIQNLKSRQPEKAYQALIRLTQIADPSALDAVITYSARKPSNIRIQAILAARQMNSPRAKPWLFVLSTGDPDANVRNAAEAAFNAISESQKGQDSDSG